MGVYVTKSFLYHPMRRFGRNFWRLPGGWEIKKHLVSPNLVPLTSSVWFVHSSLDMSLGAPSRCGCRCGNECVCLCPGVTSETNCMLCLHASWLSEQATCQERRGWILLQSGLTPAEATCGE